MAQTTIEWTAYRKAGWLVPGYTYNPWRGCSKTSPGCTHCYAEAMSKRNPAVLGVWGDNGTRVAAADSYWKQPFKWNDEAAALDEKRIVFVASLADWLEDRPDLDPLRARMLYTISKTQNLIYMCLSKRPDKFFPIMRRLTQNPEFPPAAEMARQWMAGIWPNNVWIGATAENQEWYDKREPHLVAIPAEKRFWSVEPMLERIDMRFFVEFAGGSRMKRDNACAIDLVICGGESGKSARHFDPDWARNLMVQCREAGIDFFMKQLGAKPLGIDLASKKGSGVDELPADLRVRQLPIE